MQWMDDPRAIDTVRTLCVYDSTGKAWRVSRRLLRYIKRRVQQPEKPPSPSGAGAAPFNDAWRAERTASALKAGRDLFGEGVRQ